MENNNKFISLEKGKIPPQAIDLEEVVIGAMMIDFKGYNDIKEILNPEHFY
jgi:replicative DNA helicase